MQEIALLTNNGQVPTCFPLYTLNSYHPSSFNYLDLLPPPPTTASCNVPGTTGSVGYTSGGTVVTAIPFDLPQRIMGSGNTDYYAVGSGTSLSGPHYQATDASQIVGSACNNVAIMVDALPNSGVDANLAFQCNGAKGKQHAPFDFVVNGQKLGCVAVITGHAGGDTTNLFCAVSQGSALVCAQTFAGPNSSPFTVQMAFFPN